MSVNVETYKYFGWEIQIYKDADDLWHGHGNLNSAQYSTKSVSATDRQGVIDKVAAMIDKLKDR